MPNEEVKTVNIPIDEYFDLRQRAEMNGMLMQQLGTLEGRLFDIDRRLFELEGAMRMRTDRRSDNG